MAPIMTTGCDNAGVLRPPQQEVLDLLRASGQPRPEVEPGLGDDLRRRLEHELGPDAAALSAPVIISKAALTQVLACEAHHVAEAAAPFEWTLATARGTVAHKAVQLSVHRRDRPAPLALVDDAIDRLADDPTSAVAGFLLGLDPAERAELRSDVNNVVAAFCELWPPLETAWRPQTEAPRRAELCGGTVILTGKVDLTLGAPDGLRAGRVIVDLKTGGRHGAHADDLRFYALLDTLRVGVPPFLLVGYYLDTGSFSTETVTEDVLEAAVRRTVGAARRIIQLRLGLRSPATTPGPTCRWCRNNDTCEDALAASPVS
jgi:hypothetical protein